VSALLAFAAASFGAGGLLTLLPQSAGGRRSGSAALSLGLAVGRRLRGRLRTPRELSARIAAAGSPAGLEPRDVLALKLAAAVAGVIAGLLAGAALPGRLAIASIGGAPVAGFLAPDLWLRRLARARAGAIRRELPAMLDLLRVTVQSGLSLGAALGEVGTRTRGPLAREWRAVGRECALGVPLSHSLQRLSERAPLPEVAALVAALERAARHGAPRSDTLEAQARDARAARRRGIQEEAAKAAPKIQLVVAGMLVPSVLLLVAAALVGAIVR
jgi:tight adherence protein C